MKKLLELFKSDMKTHLGFIKTRLIEIERHSRIILRLFKDNSILNSKDIKIIQSNNLRRHAINFDCFCSKKYLRTQIQQQHFKK